MAHDKEIDKSKNETNDHRNLYLAKVSLLDHFSLLPAPIHGIMYYKFCDVWLVSIHQHELTLFPFFPKFVIGRLNPWRDSSCWRCFRWWYVKTPNVKSFSVIIYFMIFKCFVYLFIFNIYLSLLFSSSIILLMSEKFCLLVAEYFNSFRRKMCHKFVYYVSFGFCILDEWWCREEIN